jgi:hypothetical protein
MPHTGMAASACARTAADGCWQPRLRSGGLGGADGGCSRKRGWLRGLSGLHSTNRCEMMRED